MAKNTLLKGNRPDIIDANIKTLKDAGYAHHRAVGTALRHSNKKFGAKAKMISAKVAMKDPMVVKIKDSGGSDA